MDQRIGVSQQKVAPLVAAYLSRATPALLTKRHEAEAPLSELMHSSRPLALIGASSSFTKVRMMKVARMPIANSARIPSPPPSSLLLETGAEARLISGAHTAGAAASVIAAAAISTLRIFIIATLNAINGAPSSR
jgi:uncharacterized protein (DUF2345 family)